MERSLWNSERRSGYDEQGGIDRTIGISMSHQPYPAHHSGRLRVGARVIALIAWCVLWLAVASRASRPGTRAARPALDRVKGDFSGARASLSNRTSNARLSLSGYGCAGRVLPVASAARTQQAGRVEYQRPGISEWYQRSTRGVEQGFTLSDPQCGARDIELEVAVDGLTPRLAASGGGVDLIDGRGALRMHYTDLSARDALGQPLPATMSVEQGRIALHVAARGGAFPIVVDPEVWSAATSLVGDASAFNDQFGMSVSLSGDTAVVGAANETVAGKPSEGAVFAFVRSGAAWSQQGPALTPSGGAAFDRVGAAVSLSGDTAVVGASATVVGSNPAQGAVYIFFRSGTTWQEQGPALSASDGAAGDGFGQAVAVSGDTALIGAPGKLVGVNAAQGAGYAFVRTAGIWQQQGSALIPSDAAATDAFGFSVAISGDTALVGAPNKTIAGNFGQGAAYVFVRSAGAWQQQGASLTAADAQPSDAFGASVALSGDTALIGASGRGQAYVFVRSGETWSAQGPALLGSGHSSGDQFGSSVSLSADTALVGAPLAAVSGAAYVFTRSGVTWTQQGPPFTSPDSTFSFGAGTSLSGDTALVGAPAGTLDAAYSFDRGACTVDSGCCSQDSDCPLGSFCPSYGVCQAKLGPGALCAADGVCGSGHCVDGVCCDTLCSGSCEACSAGLNGGLGGTCLPIPAGQDPGDECAQDPGYPSSCGADGTCDGTGACRSTASPGTACGDTLCANGSISGKLCDGAGSCITSTQSCSPYFCTGSLCGSGCSGDRDCAVGLCSAGICTDKKPPGGRCTLPSDCLDSRCVDGFCCDSVCLGPCQACGEPGSEGHCTLISGDPRPGHTECNGDPKICGGTCDGTNLQCQYQPNGKVCEQDCVAGQGLFGSCDGQGSCRLQQAASVCGAYACGENACLDSCATDDDCVNGAHCIQTQCLTPHESLCSADLSESMLGDSSVIPCLTYTCDDSRGVCRSQCQANADCSAGNVCDSNHQCGPPVAAGGDANKSSSACGCRVGTLGDAKGASFALFLLLGAALRRVRKRAFC